MQTAVATPVSRRWFADVPVSAADRRQSRPVVRSGPDASDAFTVSPTQTPHRRFRWKRWLTVVLLVLLPAWIFHPPLLRGLAELLVVEEQRDQAELVLLLDGDRLFDKAAEFYRAGAPKVVIFHGRRNRLVRMGILLPGDEFARRELLKRGVANDDLVFISVESGGRIATATALSDWLQQHPDQTANVLCDRFNSRAWKLVFHRNVDPSLLKRIRLIPLANRRFDESNWWRSKLGTAAFVNGFLRLGFYCWHVGPEADRGELTQADFRAAFTRGAGQ